MDLSFPFHLLDGHGVVIFPFISFLVFSHVPYGCGLEKNSLKALKQLMLSY